MYSNLFTSCLWKFLLSSFRYQTWFKKFQFSRHFFFFNSWKGACVFSVPVFSLQKSFCKELAFNLVNNCNISFAIFIVKHGAILHNEAEVFSLSITNPNGWPMLPFDWLIQSSLILAKCHRILFLCRFLRWRNKFEN